VSAPLVYLLDTNIVSSLVRNPHGTASGHIKNAGEDKVCTSVVVAAELRFGAVKSGFAKLAQRIDLILSALEILPLETPVDRFYASLRNHLSRQGTPIGPDNMLIAVHALAKDLTVVTTNVGEFSRVPGLTLENWLEI
jgi:tRNA(fMet)-specific endonuclease VapC